MTREIPDIYAKMGEEEIERLLGVDKLRIGFSPRNPSPLNKLQHHFTS